MLLVPVAPFHRYLHSTIIYAGVLLFSYTLYTAASASVGLGSISQVGVLVAVAEAVIADLAGRDSAPQLCLQAACLD